jgi:hypothetical protein
MKKLMALMLGMSLLFGSVSIVFGQDTPPKKSKKINKTKGSQKKQQAPKKTGAGK